MIEERFLPVQLRLGSHAAQVRFLNDWDHRFFVVPSGRRARKTLISMRKILLKALRTPDARFFHGAPTRPQAKAIFWKRLKNETRYFQATRPNETELTVTLQNGTEIHVVGLERAERIEGHPWHGCHITECADLHPDAWPEHIRPVLSDTRGMGILDGVPEGMTWYYDLACYAAGGSLPETLPGQGSWAENPDDPDWVYYHWFSEDVLAPEEIEAAKRELDEHTYLQEYRGSFLGKQGRAYYGFGPDNIKPIEYQPGRPVHVGMDFNVDPMTATLSYIEGEKILQFGEFYLHNSNTYEMADLLKDRFGILLADPNPEQIRRVDHIHIYPDSTGKAERSNATRSDIAILKRAGFTVHARSTNPRVKDRINAVNAKIKNTKGERHYFVDPSCVHTIEDLNKVERTSDGRENKDQEKQGLVHISSALGYMITYLFPVRVKTEFKAA